MKTLALVAVVLFIIGCSHKYYYEGPICKNQKFRYSHQWEDEKIHKIPIETIEVVKLFYDGKGYVKWDTIGHKYIVYKRNSAIITVPEWFFRTSAKPIKSK